MQVTLVLPSLLALPRDALASTPALGALAMHAGSPLHLDAGIDAALLAAAGLPATTPLAPLAARGAGVAPESDVIARADPVALIAGRDDVLLGGRIDNLSTADADHFIARLNAHFGGDGLAFFAVRPDTWFVRLAGMAAPQTTSLAQVRGAMHEHLPRGDGAGQWKRWLSEMQMLLHEDPRNVARERAGQTPVTGIWIADAGIDIPSPSHQGRRWFAPVGRAGDVARGLAADGEFNASEPPATFAQLPQAANAVVVLPRLQTIADLKAAMTGWLSPALAALDRGALAALQVVADDGREAFSWTARPMPWWRRWRSAMRQGVFALPSLPEP